MRLKATQDISRDTSKLIVHGADNSNWRIYFTDPNDPMEFIESGLIATGGPASNVTAAIKSYW